MTIAPRISWTAKQHFRTADLPRARNRPTPFQPKWGFVAARHL